MYGFLGTPDPIAFTIFGKEIRWYAIMLSTGIILGFFIFVKRAVKRGFIEDDLYDLFLVMVPLGIIGARLYYVVFYNLEYYLKNPSEIIAIWNGGLAIHGGIIFGALGVWLVCRRHKWKLMEVLDLLMPSLALGQAIGRWGNYFNMEAHGVETDLPWAIKVFEHGQWLTVHPTFLYESIWNVGVCLILLLVIAKKEKFYGTVTAHYFIIYSIGRFWIEGLRTDSLMFLGMRQAQLISVALVIAGFIYLKWVKKSGKLAIETVNEIPAEEPAEDTLEETEKDE